MRLLFQWNGKDKAKVDDNNSNATETAAIPQSSAGYTAAVPLGNVIWASVDSNTKDYLERVIAYAPFGGTLYLAIDNSKYLDTAIINALEARSDLSLILTVNYQGVPVSISIPAGYNLMALVEKNGKVNYNTLIYYFAPKSLGPLTRLRKRNFK